MVNLIPEKPWTHILEDFITKLPLAQGYNSILVVVNRLTKIVYFIPTTEKTLTEKLARLFRNNVWKLHSLLKSIISDRGPQFMAGLMQERNGILEIESKLSTAFHPQTDRQTESVMNIKWDYSYYQPWSNNEWLVDEMLAMRDEDITMQ